MLYLSMKLTFVQMYNLGMHLGHTMEMSKFLSYWIYGGWSSNLFIINLMKTRMLLKSCLETIERAMGYYSPIWFVNLDKKKGNFMASYATISGEPYVSFYWMSGTLTNYKSMFSWFNVLYELLTTQKYKMRHRDKLKLLGYFGFLNHSTELPGMGFVTSTMVSWKAMSEFWVVSMPCAAVIDSNVLSWNVSLPIPGNDDSFLCLNYYCYMMTHGIMHSKGFSMMSFSRIASATSFNYSNAMNTKKKMLLIYFYKSRDGAFFRVRNNLMKKFEEPVKPLDFFSWEMKNLVLDMGVFNTEYSGFKNDGFFNFFGNVSNYSYDSKGDSFLHNDPYKIF